MLGFILVTAMFVIINLVFAGAFYLVFSIGKTVAPGLMEFQIFMLFLGLVAFAIGLGFTFWFVRFIESLHRILGDVRASIRLAPTTISDHIPWRSGGGSKRDTPET